MLPQPGEGPGEKTRRAGLFRMKIYTRTSDGARYVAARGDPGYQAKSVMLGESALCLALDRDRLPARRGPHSGDRDEHRTGRQAQGGGAHPCDAADQPLTASCAGAVAPQLNPALAGRSPPAARI